RTHAPFDDVPRAGDVRLGETPPRPEDTDVGRRVKNAIRSRKSLFDGHAIAEIATVLTRQDDDVVAALAERLDDITPEKSRAARDDRSHRTSFSIIRARRGRSILALFRMATGN